MRIKIVTTILASISVSIMCLTCISNAQVQESVTVVPVAIPSADSTTKKVVDSTKIIRDEFVAQKQSIKDKVDYLQGQHKKIKEVQRKIDSVTTINSVLGYSIIFSQ